MAMPHDVFVSYSQSDRAAAQEVCTTLEANGITCWIAPRDIPAGVTWSTAIVGAIESCRCLVLICSAQSNSSKQMARELQIADENNRPVVPMRLSDVELGGAFRYYLSNTQWLNLYPGSLREHSAAIVSAARNSIDTSTGEELTTNVSSKPASSRGTFGFSRPFSSLTKKRGALSLAAGVLVVVVAGAIISRPSWIGEDPAPVSWEGTSNAITKTFGSKDWCLFEMELSSIRLVMKTSKSTVDSSDLTFLYNEESLKDGCKSGIPRNTLKRLTPGSYRLDAESIHIQYTDASAQAPIVQASLDGKFEKSKTGGHIVGVLTVERIDQPAQIFNWKAKTSADLRPVTH